MNLRRFSHLPLKPSAIAITLTAVFSGQAYAQTATPGQREIIREQVNPQTDDALKPWLGGNWQLGAIGRVSSNPYRGADSVDPSALPVLAYDAERLHIGLDGIDAKVWKNEFASVSILGGLRMEPFDPGDSSYLNGLEERDMAFEAGVGGSLRLWRGEFRANYLTDLNDAYGGHEIDVGYYLPTNYEKFQFNFGGGVTWQSEELVDYNVGVRRNEVRADPGFYAPGAAFIPHLDFSVTYPVTERFAVVGTSGVRFLPDEYTDSSIIEDDYVLSAGLVLVYNF
ncbi:MipA/OmpV family protein [Thalassospira sp.]|uniref:MipA/OmpV family protein n=1 Tax=Thalassospira sp. TaxID=1912094 RepID=UPI000C526796|nr:MipA/OmpV family protein [Thalassospira sp.]MBC06696.1 structural protein MipA [Thalassospira sp.]|tara:strand:+ start:2537 stop:3382 length:846 start_codon:yes stop_codon:yes gene_type:complete